MSELADPYVWIRFIHLAGAITAVGAVTITDSMLALLHVKKDFASVFEKIATELSLMVWIGFFLLSGTGMYILSTMPEIIYSSIMQLKMVLVTVVFLNGIILNEKVTPRFRKISKDWDDDETRSHFERYAGVFALISVIGWWSIILLVYLKAYI